jgi:Tol biopolymer transport system component/DNA-binding winged helix-turn-helix (wHTH) protein
MSEANPTPEVIRFGTYEVHPRSGEIRKAGAKLRLSEQPFQLLLALLEQPGEVVTREELQKRLWPNTFVDVDHGLSTAVNKIREALSDSAENPRFVETLPRRGYRFIAPVIDSRTPKPTREAEAPSAPADSPNQYPAKSRTSPHVIFVVASVVLLAAAAAWFISRPRTNRANRNPLERTLTRVTFQPGLQTGATWSPDGHSIAYASIHDGKSDIWVQSLTGGEPVQLTHGPSNNWQPDWSPDGKSIAYRAEDGAGGLYIVPAGGRAEVRRRISPFGIYPRWSSDNHHLAFLSIGFGLATRVFVVDVDGITNEPREVLTQITSDPSWQPLSASWHPDGKRVSLWAWALDKDPIHTFWTGPIKSSDSPIRTEIPKEISQEAEDAAGPGVGNWGDDDYGFQWAPAGNAIYLERSFRGARNIFRLSVDPATLRATGIEPVTTGTQNEVELAVSRDGRRLAFTSQAYEVRAWIFPFDPLRGRLTGDGSPATSPTFEAWQGSLTRDGQKLAIASRRAGKWEIWQKSLVDGSETPIAADDSYLRNEPQWSPDGKQLAYMRQDTSALKDQAVIWDSATREERAVTDWRGPVLLVFDWSADGRWLLASVENPATHHHDIVKIPVSSHSGEVEQTLIPTVGKTDLYQPRFSPDGRWIVFEAVQMGAAPYDDSSIFVVPSTGGQWIRITDDKHWNDKPRWSPDGKSIYFISDRGGYYNVFRKNFNPSAGKPVGDATQITNFADPGLMISPYLSEVGFSITKDRLMLTMSHRSGSIWILDHIDR